MAAKIVRVAALQPALRVGGDADAQRVLRDGVARATAEGPLDLIVLPEAIAGPMGTPETAAGRWRDFLSGVARGSGAVVVGGSFRCADDAGRWRNVCYAFDPAGRQIGVYSKRVLFGREIGRLVPGEQEGVFEHAGLRFGVLICGDLWRPELARALVDRVDVLCVPARTGVPEAAHVTYARTLWWNLALTRGMENGLAVVVSDWAHGRHALAGQSHWTAGGSSIVDPSRRPDVGGLQRRIEDGAAGFLRAAIDVEAVRGFRAYRRSVGLLPPTD